LRPTDPKPTAEEKNVTELVKEKLQATEKGRIAEIVGVTLAFAAVIVIMSVVFVIM